MLESRTEGKRDENEEQERSRDERHGNVSWPAAIRFSFLPFSILFFFLSQERPHKTTYLLVYFAPTRISDRDFQVKPCQSCMHQFKGSTSSLIGSRRTTSPTSIFATKSFLLNKSTFSLMLCHPMQVLYL
jgi:hypothetical protein